MNTQIITTQLSAAAEILRHGGLVAVPTETVYGLAANGMDPAAVARIYQVKGRPEAKPLSLMVRDASAMARCCVDVPQAAYALADRFWPGPLTIVLRAGDAVPELVRAGGETVGLRCPDHPVTLELLRLAGTPLAAPSANPSGEPSPGTADEVLRYFNGRIDAVIDGGACALGRESTVADLSQTPYRILRVGALPRRGGKRRSAAKKARRGRLRRRCRARGPERHYTPLCPRRGRCAFARLGAAGRDAGRH